MWLAIFIICVIPFITVLVNRATIEYNAIKRYAGVSLYMSSKSIIVIGYFIVFFFISAFRSANVGCDTQSYLDLFDKVANSGYYIGDTRYEIGYVYLNKLVAFLYDSHFFFLFFTSFLLMLGYAIFIRKLSKIIWLSFFLFFILRYFDQSMNLLRQNFAIILIFISYLRLRKKKIYQSILWTFLASCFHLTAITFLLGILAYKMCNWNLNKILLCFSLLGIVLYIACGSLTNLIFNNIASYASYANSVYNEGGARIAVVLQLLMSLLVITGGILCNRTDYEREDYTENKMLLLLLLFGVMFLILSLQFNQMTRLASYFSVFAIIYLPNSLIAVSKKKRFIGYILIFLVGVSSYLMINMLRPQWAGIYPYTFSFLN